MQIDAVSQRITTAGHNVNVQLNPQTGQLVVDDWRLRGWITDAGAPAWAAPTTSYGIDGTASYGDLIYKSTSATLYDAAIGYDTPIGYDGGKWYWDLGFQDLGVATPVTLPDGVTTDTPYISNITLNGTQDLICFYSNRFRGSYHSGIWVMKVTDNGSGNVQWGEPIEVFGNVAIDDFNFQSQLFVTFPRLLTINSEYWIVALECSKEVNVLTYHLCYFRSADGLHWTDREYLAGVSNDSAESNVGINKYDTSTAFALNDLKHGYITVSGNKVYLSSKTGSKFSCAATSLVGVSNTNVQLDITGEVPNYTFSEPTAPSSAQGNYTLLNPYKKYNGSSILVPGARLTHKAGYVTTNGNELCTIGYEVIDEVRQSTNIGKNELTIVTSDYTAWLRDWTSDMYWEYWSPQQSVYEQFCDLTAISTINGRFFVGFGNSGTDLTAASPDPNAITDEDMGYINKHRVCDGGLEFGFQFAGSIPIQVTAAAVVQGMTDRQFYAIAYWVVLGKWVIAQAVPTTNGNKLYNFNLVYIGSAQSLSANTQYYGKIQQWHNHIQFATSTDNITWTTQLDYKAPQPPASAAITSNLGYWGLLGHSYSTNSGAIGNTDASSGQQPMYSGSSPLYYAVKATTGAYAGTVTELAGLFTQTGVPPDLTIGIVADAGGHPADITNYNNVLYSTTMKSMQFSSSDAPYWRGVPVPPYVRVAAGTDYWIFFTFNGSLSGGQTFEWYSGGSATTYTSGNGVSWSLASGSAAACMFVEYDNGLTKFQSMNWTSVEPPKTIEYIAKDIAAKSGILNCTVDSFIAQADLTSGWQPSNKGTFGDFVADMDVDTTSGPCEVYFRATTNTDPTTGVKIVMGNPVTIYRNNSLIMSMASLQTLPTTYHLTVANLTKFVYIYVNDTLVTTCYNGNLTTPGYFGVGTTGKATITNLRIADMREVKPYFVIESGKTAQAALNDLVQYTRYKYFVRFDGSLRIGSFPARTSVDSYQSTVIDTSNIQSMRYAVNQLMPAGNYYAMRFAAYELDQLGKRRFKKETYTDAQSNEDAYLAASLVLQRAREMTQQYSLDSNAIWPAEREDRITVVNPLDGTSTDYIINNIEQRYDFETATTSQRLGLRIFVA